MPRVIKPYGFTALRQKSIAIEHRRTTNLAISWNKRRGHRTEHESLTTTRLNRQRSTCHSHTIRLIPMTARVRDRVLPPLRFDPPSPLTHQTPRSLPPPEGRDRAIVSRSALASALVIAYHLPQRTSASAAVGAPPACNPTYPASSPVYPACNPLHLSASAHQ